MPDKANFCCFKKIINSIFNIEKENNRLVIRLLGLKISVRFKINNKYYLALNKIKKYKYVHIMTNDKFNKAYVDFLNKNFDPKEHIVLCKKGYDGVLFPFPKGDNVIKIDSCLNIKQLGLDNVKKIFIHSIFDYEIIDWFYNNPKLLDKTYWIMWGYDLYNLPDEEKSNFFRNNVHAYCAVASGDEKYALQKFNPNKKAFVTPYLGPISAEMLLNAKKSAHEGVVVQINNSCDDSTLDVLEDLSKFKNIKVRTIVTYGKTDYKQEIIDKGEKLFGKNFSYINEYMSTEQYCDFMNEADILVMGQNRQQGIGNATIALTLGAKVFIRSGITTVGYLNDLGFEVFDTNKIPDMDFEEFVNYPNEIKQKNINAGKIYYDDNNAPVEQWKTVFEDK